MTSRERFRAACEHRTPDLPPVDYLAHPETDRKLRAALGVTSERELLDRLGADFFYLPGRDISQNEGALPFYKHRDRLVFSAGERTCPLCIRWQRGAFNSKFAVDEAIAGPFTDTATAADILAFPWPRAADFDFSPLQAEADANRERVRVGGLWTGILGDSYRMFGFQNFLYAMAAEPELVHTLVDRMTQMYLELNDAYFAALKGRLDVWFFGNDFGSQESLLFSCDMWAEFFLQNLKCLTALAHCHGLKVMMHSCGAIAELIPLLIEAGVDILDPIQVTAKGMVPAELKARFGDRIVFHGGIDTQQILPFGTQHQVAAHVRETVVALGRDGGYLFAPSQILGPDIPTENIITMYETINTENAEMRKS
jgi:uroporphyrinogen decarboxylase